MTIFRIVGLAGLALALIATFVQVPYAAPVIAVLGLIMGWTTAAEHHVRVIASAIALHVLAGTFDGIPTVGPYLSTFIANMGYALAGGAIAIIFRNVYMRLRG